MAHKGTSGLAMEYQIASLFINRLIIETRFVAYKRLFSFHPVDTSRSYKRVTFCLQMEAIVAQNDLSVDQARDRISADTIIVRKQDIRKIK